MKNLNPKAAAPRDPQPEPPRFGKDEMNLVEYPIAGLTQQRAGNGVREIRFEVVHRKTGKRMAALWRVQGGAESGLPGPNEEKLYLVLMELWREQGQTARVYFAQADVLRRLGVANNARGYAQLRDWFERLGSVRVRADNCFWRPEIENYAQSFQFGVLGPVDLVPEPAGRKGQKQMPLSSFTWFPEFEASLRVGNIRTLDLDFAFSLQLPLSLKLFRYLDKHRYGKTGSRRGFEIELHRLCEVHLGMTPSSYASKLKERLAGAHAELVARGFLSEVTYRAMKTSSAEKVCYAFGAASEISPKSLGEGASTLRNPPLIAHRDLPSDASEANTAILSLEKSPGVTIYPNEAYAVFSGLEEAEKEHLRLEARAEIEPAFWDRLENPDSPMALSLWELVQNKYPEKFEKPFD